MNEVIIENPQLRDRVERVARILHRCNKWLSLHQAAEEVDPEMPKPRGSDEDKETEDDTGGDFESLLDTSSVAARTSSRDAYSDNTRNAGNEGGDDGDVDSTTLRYSDDEEEDEEPTNDDGVENSYRKEQDRSRYQVQPGHGVPLSDHLRWTANTHSRVLAGINSIING